MQMKVQARERRTSQIRVPKRTELPCLVLSRRRELLRVLADRGRPHGESPRGPPVDAALELFVQLGYYRRFERRRKRQRHHFSRRPGTERVT